MSGTSNSLWTTETRIQGLLGRVFSRDPPTLQLSNQFLPQPRKMQKKTHPFPASHRISPNPKVDQCNFHLVKTPGKNILKTKICPVVIDSLQHQQGEKQKYRRRRAFWTRNQPPEPSRPEPLRGFACAVKASKRSLRFCFSSLGSDFSRGQNITKEQLTLNGPTHRDVEETTVFFPPREHHQGTSP